MLAPAVVLLLMAASAAAQPRIRFADGVETAGVVASALALSPEMEQACLAVEAETGALLLAASPFDLAVRTALQRSRDHLPVVSARNGILMTEAVETRASAVKGFRSGLILASELSFARVRTATIGLSRGQIDSSLSVRVPLAAGRGGSAATGVEHAAQESLAASRLERHHVAARVVHDAVAAYWRYRAAQEQLQTYVESAERAERLVEETMVLIRADERPASDLDLVASNRAQKATVVTSARQTLIEAQHALGIAMGLTAAAIPALGPPLTAFPGTDAGPGSRGGAAAVRAALAGRRDLAALRTRRDGARLAWEGAQRDVRSRWDLVTRVGFTRVGRGAIPDGVAALAPGIGGLNSLVQVEYEPVAVNRAVRGRALGRAASHRAAVVAVGDLARRIEANVLVATAAVANAAAEALAAEEAVRLSERSVLTEQAKFRLGLTTLFDAILAEDSLTNARLLETNARLRFASALTRLRFETGALLDDALVPTDGGGTASFHFEECRS